MSGILLDGGDLNVEFYEQSAKAIKEYDIPESYFEKEIYNKAYSGILLHFLPHYPYEILKPLRISVEVGKENSCFIVSNEELNKFGIGLTKEEAVKGFEDGVVTDYLLLQESKPEELTEGAKELLKLYQSFISLR